MVHRHIRIASRAEISSRVCGSVDGGQTLSVRLVVPVLGQVERAQQVVEHRDVALPCDASADQPVSADAAADQFRVVGNGRARPRDVVYADGCLMDTLYRRLVHGLSRLDSAGHFAVWIPARRRGDALPSSLGS